MQNPSHGFLLANMIKYAEGCTFVCVYQRNPQEVSSLITPCESNNTQYKKLLSSISLPKIQYYFSFSIQRSEVFTEFLKPLMYAMFFCSWFKSLLQSLGPRDETPNFVWFDRILPSTKLLWVNPVGYWWVISHKLFQKAAGTASCFILNKKVNTW